LGVHPKVQALELQAEGPDAITTHKAKAYTSIEKASYSGHLAKFTFDMYISAHLMSHNVLNLLGEPISESKKVIDFLAGITAPSLSTTKENVIGDVTKLENFDVCQQYLKQILLAQKACKGPSTTISSVNTINCDTNPTQGGGKKKKQKTSSTLTKHYTAEEWGKLSVEELARVMKLRKQKKAQRVSATTTQSTPKISLVTTLPPVSIKPVAPTIVVPEFAPDVSKETTPTVSNVSFTSSRPDPNWIMKAVAAS
jgi:hypothetical protein